MKRRLRIGLLKKIVEIKNNDKKGKKSDRKDKERGVRRECKKERKTKDVM